ncbi:alpha/beta hydrolase [bacterium]|nr:alpha/beta hydrolase [bacterium]
MKKPNKQIYFVFGLILLLLLLAEYFHYRTDTRVAYERLNVIFYPKTMQTEFGKMSYLDQGSGEAVLYSHGVFGGYDQGYITLNRLVDFFDHRGITPSRFGYPGSDVPENPTPQNQAKAFLYLLDHLGIQKAYIITNSSGGAAGISFAITYPDRVKGLILLSSEVPYEMKENESAKSKYYLPPIFLNEFPMWFLTKYGTWFLNHRFASNLDGATKSAETSSFFLHYNRYSDCTILDEL